MIRRDLLEKLVTWKENPILFVKEVFQVEHLDPWQEDMLAAFPKNQRLVAKACKGPGKTALLAWVAWNFLLTRPHPKVVATSISGDNLRDGLWTELSKWQRRSKICTELFEWSAQRVVYKKSPSTWYASARTWPKSADASEQASSLAGIHADYVLFLLDEIGDYPDGVVAAAEGALSTGIETKIVAAGNPTQTQGPLYRACTKDRKLWYVKEITGDPDDPKRSSRIDKKWAREQIEKWGRDSNYVRVNVLGQFPIGSANTLVSPDVAEKAIQHWVLPREYKYAPKILGVDVARFGDDRTVIVMRQGCVMYKPMVFRELNVMEVSGQVSRIIRDIKPDAVFIDAIGIGAGVADRLRELGHPIVAVESSVKAIDTARFLNKRAEMWWDMAEWMKKACIPDNGDLVAELTTPMYKFNSSGQLVLESKDDMKKRGVASPDIADALALTFAAPVAARQQSALFPMAQRESNRAVTEYDPYAREAS